MIKLRPKRNIPTRPVPPPRTGQRIKTTAVEEGSAELTIRSNLIFYVHIRQKEEGLCVSSCGRNSGKVEVTAKGQDQPVVHE